MDRFYSVSTLIVLYLSAVALSHDKMFVAFVMLAGSLVFLWKAGAAKPEQF